MAATTAVILTNVPKAPVQQQYKDTFSIEHRVAILNREAKQFMTVGNYSAALTCCNEAVLLNSSPLAILNRAYCFKHLKDWSSSIADFTAYLNHDPLSHTAYIQRGLCYTRLSQYHQGIADLCKAVELDPSPTTFFNRGCVYNEAHEYYHAIEDFTKVIDNKDTETALSIRALYQRGLSYNYLENFVNAVEDLNFILRQDPNSLAPRVLLAKVLKQQGNLSLAEEHISQAIMLDVSQIETYIERGDIRCRMGIEHKILEAIKDFATAINIITNPNSFTRVNSAGRETDKESKPSSPFLEPTKSLKKLPSMSKLGLKKVQSNEECHTLAAVLLKQANAKLLLNDTLSWKDALKDAEYAITLSRDLAFAKTTLVNCLIRNKCFDEAIRMIEKQLENAPRDWGYLLQHAYCLRASQRELDAIESLTKIITTFDGNSENEQQSVSMMVRVLEMRGLMLFESQAFKFALADFGKALSLAPDKPNIQLFRGICYHKLGYHAQALADYFEADTLGFSSKQIVYLLIGNASRSLGYLNDSISYYTKGIETQETAAESKDKKSVRLHYRLSLLLAMSYIDIGDYKASNEVLIGFTEFLGIKRDDMMLRISTHSDDLITQLSTDFPLDKSMLWLFFYHLALVFHELRKFEQSTEILRICFEGPLAENAPDNSALGCILFFYVVGRTRLSFPVERQMILELQQCLALLSECLSSEWALFSDRNQSLCYFSRAKCYQRLGKHEQALEDFTKAIDYNIEDCLPFYLFRRAWSNKAVNNLKLAAADFETAKILRSDDPNFTVSYREIANIDYIEIDLEPDLSVPFKSFIPLDFDLDDIKAIR